MNKKIKRELRAKLINSGVPLFKVVNGNPVNHLRRAMRAYDRAGMAGVRAVILRAEEPHGQRRHQTKHITQRRDKYGHNLESLSRLYRNAAHNKKRRGIADIKSSGVVRRKAVFDGGAIGRALARVMRRAENG